MLTIPTYIEKLGLQETKLSFKSSMAGIIQLFDTDVPLVRGGAELVTERAKLAFGAALTEWVVWRLEPFTDTSDLLQFTESLWAAVIDYRYTSSIDHVRPSDGDPVNYHQFVTWEKANALFLLCQEEDGNPANCARLSLLARHVLPKKHHAALKVWIEFIVRERLLKLWPVEDSEDANILQGPLVPREAFNPDIDFDINKTHDMLSRFLESLDHKTNPYLRSPTEMKKLGFKGKPYRI